MTILYSCDFCETDHATIECLHPRYEEFCELEEWREEDRRDLEMYEEVVEAYEEVVEALEERIEILEQGGSVEAQAQNFSRIQRVRGRLEKNGWMLPFRLGMRFLSRY